jgi:hypothetical protein
MDVKEAVKRAKEIISTVFEDESVENIGLEEVDYDIGNKQWHVTIGFSRPWDESLSGQIALLTGSKKQRTYKVVSLQDDQTNRYSIKNREQAA